MTSVVHTDPRESSRLPAREFSYRVTSRGWCVSFGLVEVQVVLDCRCSTWWTSRHAPSSVPGHGLRTRGTTGVSPRCHHRDSFWVTGRNLLAGLLLSSGSSVVTDPSD